MNEKKSKVTIQINNLEAFERLIGGDTELEMELRQATAVAYTRKNLSKFFDKAIDAQIGPARKAAEMRLRVKISELLEKRVGWKNSSSLTDEAKKSIDDLAKHIVLKCIHERVREAIDGMDIKKMVDDAVTHEQARAVRDAVRDAVKRRLGEVSAQL